MSNADAVATNLPDSFFSYKIASAVNANIGVSGAAQVVLPILGGGVTSNGGGYIVRRITIHNRTGGNVALANVSINTSSDGNVGNSLTGNVLLSSLTANNTYQDFVLNSGANVTIQTAQALFANVNTNVANAVVTFNVYGDMVSF